MANPYCKNSLHISSVWKYTYIWCRLYTVNEILHNLGYTFCSIFPPNNNCHIFHQQYIIRFSREGETKLIPKKRIPSENPLKRSSELYGDHVGLGRLAMEQRTYQYRQLYNNPRAIMETI